jgi:hypothetical protein
LLELYYQELATWLELITGFNYSARQVRQVFYRHLYRYRVINEFRPLAQDPEYFAFYRNHAMFEGGPIRARHCLWVDEAGKKEQDAWRRRGLGPRGGAQIVIPVQFRRAANSSTIILALGISGIRAAIPVDTQHDGTVGKKCI